MKEKRGYIEHTGRELRELREEERGLSLGDKKKCKRKNNISKSVKIEEMLFVLSAVEYPLRNLALQNLKQ